MLFGFSSIEPFENKLQLSYEKSSIIIYIFSVIKSKILGRIHLLGLNMNGYINSISGAKSLTVKWYEYVNDKKKIIHYFYLDTDFIP